LTTFCELFAFSFRRVKGKGI